MRKTLELDGNDARKFYPSAPDFWKNALENSFGKAFFSQKITDRVKTIEDIYEIKGIDPSTYFNEKDTTDEIAYKQVKLICEVLNEGTAMDFSNGNQPKWRPWFEWNCSGFVFSTSFTDYDRANSAVGPRLCFKSKELCDYAATQFIDIYRNLLS